MEAATVAHRASDRNPLDEHARATADPEGCADCGAPHPGGVLCDGCFEARWAFSPAPLLVTVGR